MENPRFPSKVDWWLALVLAALPVAALVSAVTSIMHGVWLGGIGVVIVGAIYAGAVFPMYYELDDDDLVIRFGLMKSRIRYRDIKGVTPTRNPLSSPALSLDRLHIDAGNPLGPNISPKDRDGFLRALAARAPQLKLVGDALVPAG